MAHDGCFMLLCCPGARVPPRSPASRSRSVKLAFETSATLTKSMCRHAAMFAGMNTGGSRFFNPAALLTESTMGRAMGVVCSTSSDLAKMVLGCYRLTPSPWPSAAVNHLNKNPFLNPARRQVREGKKRRVRWNGKVMCPNFNNANQRPRGSFEQRATSQGVKALS